MCTGEEQISDDNGFEMEAQLQFVSDSVMAFAHAFKVHDTRYSSPDVVCVCDDVREYTIVVVIVKSIFILLF